MKSHCSFPVPRARSRTNFEPVKRYHKQKQIPIITHNNEKNLEIVEVNFSKKKDQNMRTGRFRKVAGMKQKGAREGGNTSRQRTENERKRIAGSPDNLQRIKSTRFSRPFSESKA